MPWSRPTFSTLLQQVAADIASALPGADALLRYSDLNIIAKVLQELCQLHYGYQDWIAKQCVPFTATEEFLEGWAALKNVFRKPARTASGAVSFANSTPGAPVPSGTPLVRGDDVTYTTTDSSTVDSGGNVTVTCQADDPGAAGNCLVGTVLTFGTAVPGLQSSGAVSTVIAGGTDVETDDELRARMLAAYQNPPQGGDAADYANWATAVPGVTRAWCAPNANGPGTVIVYFMEDDAESAFGGFPQGTNGVATNEPRDTPATGDQLAVANAIFPQQPVTALVYAYAPTADPIDFTITGLSSAPTSVKNQVKAAIDDAFTRLATPGGVYLPNSSVPAGQVNLDDIETAIASVPGTEGFVITVPSANIVSGTGQLATRGVVTFA